MDGVWSRLKILKGYERDHVYWTASHDLLLSPFIIKQIWSAFKPVSPKHIFEEMCRKPYLCLQCGGKIGRSSHSFKYRGDEKDMLATSKSSLRYLHMAWLLCRDSTQSLQMKGLYTFMWARRRASLDCYNFFHLRHVYNTFFFYVRVALHYIIYCQHDLFIPSAAMVVEIGVQFTMLFWKPHPDHVFVFFLIPMLQCVADGDWHTQLNGW